MYDDHLYKDLTYKIIGIAFEIHKELGPVHKEIVYHNALIKEFKLTHIPYFSEKTLSVTYKNSVVGSYKPDFIIDNKVILEIKAMSFLPKSSETQLTYYLKGTGYKIGLLLNFGAKHLEVRRRVYDRVISS
jgi:GxxExxY protein